MNVGPAARAPSRCPAQDPRPARIAPVPPPPPPRSATAARATRPHPPAGTMASADQKKAALKSTSMIWQANIDNLKATAANPHVNLRAVLAEFT